jgi:hypothetical protein
MRGTRNDENVESIHWIFFDVDDLATYDTMLRRLRELGIAHLLTETASHMLHGLPRWHLYLPLEQPITFPAPGEGHQAIMRTRKAQYMAEYAVIAAWLCRLGEIPKNDSSVNDLSQPCYVARRATEDVPARQVFFSGGRRIRWHQLLLYLGHQPTLLPVPTAQAAAAPPSPAPATGAAPAGAGAAPESAAASDGATGGAGGGSAASLMDKTSPEAINNIETTGPVKRLSIGTAVPYAIWHEVGTRRMPRRQLVALSAARRQRITRIFQIEALAAAGRIGRQSRTGQAT